MGQRMEREVGWVELFNQSMMAEETEGDDITQFV